MDVNEGSFLDDLSRLLQLKPVRRKPRVAIDRWTCRCGWVYEGTCRPHEEFGWTVSEVGKHQWDVHQSVKESFIDGTWEHLDQ